MNLRRQVVATTLVSLCLFNLPQLTARYRRADLDNVPLEKVLKNLGQQMEKNPKDVTPRFNLARAHAMAYALKSETVPVWKGKEDKGIWFSYEPRHVPFTAKATDDQKKLQAAKEHLRQAIKLYQEVVQLAPQDLTARLGLGWCLDQAKETTQAMREYRAVVEEGWKKEKDLKGAPLGWHSVTSESARYLMPLLDAEKDKEEIARLNERIKQLAKIPRPVTPLVVPLHDGLALQDLVARHGQVAFDADGSGRRERWSWITPKCAWLVYDRQGTGQVASALQLFGNVTFWMFWENGYQALSALDDNGDGELTGPELEGLALWHDANANGLCDPGEVKTVGQWGIVALSCRHEKISSPDGVAQSPQGVRFRNRQVRPTFDVILWPR